MNPWHDYDYSVLRLVPDVACEAFVNVGVVLHARTARFLRFRYHLRPALLEAACPGTDLALLQQYLEAYARIAEGAEGGGPIGLLPPSERFHWLTAPRSTMLQPSPVHAGRTQDPEATFGELFARYVGAG